MISGAGSGPLYPVFDPGVYAGPDRQDVANFEEEKGAFLAQLITQNVQAIPYKEKILRSKRRLKRKRKRVSKKAEAAKLHFLRHNMPQGEADHEERVFA
ncbi:hypothetical protein [Spongorhabdus nitratireducens]